MFKKWFGTSEPETQSVTTPEILGFHLGGAFELDDLKIRLREPQLVVEGMARTQLIQAVGEVALDESSTLLRFYTDDEGFIQVLMSGGKTENHVADVKLWYFYETKNVGNESDWQDLISQKISQPAIEFEGHTYTRVWDSISDSSPPVAMSETTYSEDGQKESTDQFVMLYERQIEEDFAEYVMFSGEEKLINGQLDRCFVISTGFDLQAADFEVLS